MHPTADLIWCETSEPDLDEARQFAEAIPCALSRGKLLAYNCSPSFHWKAQSWTMPPLPVFQSELAGDGIQISVRHGWPASTRWNFSMFDLASQYAQHGMGRLLAIAGKRSLRKWRQATRRCGTRGSWEREIL